MKKRRLLSIVLSLCMVLALVPQMVFAEGEISGTPSVSAYATKDQLKGDTFAPDSSGNATNIGKLVFGKNSSGGTQEWYILGKDTYVSGDNTIIFAASTIATNQSFEDDKDNNKTEASLWSDCNYNGVSITEVYPNHYGASDLRAALQSMATNETYFTTAEQGMMNATTVTTKDMKNSSVPYTTTDKLYALAADNFQGNTIIAGSKNQIVLASTSYWNSGGKDFWLRSPYTVYSNYTEAWRNIAIKWNIEGACVNNPTVNALWDVRPASNLNLTDVLFASAAKATSSGTIADGTAMTLRLDGKDKNIGAVTYSTRTGDIFATKGSTTGDVALVVQGNDGTNDWYYSKQITGTETEIVNISDIKTELGLSADIDLSTAKIWLETTDAANGMIYAVDPITSDELIRITSPDSMTVENGTAYEDMNLPETVNVKTVGNSVTKLPVVWITDPLAGGSYDPNIKTEQTVKLYGILQRPDAFEENPDEPAATTITITIKAAPAAPDDINKGNDSKPASDNSLDTGDSTNMPLLIGLMLLSIAGITGVTGYRRRKRIDE